MKKISIPVLSLLLINSVLIVQEFPAGKFIKRYWYQNGVEHGNPNFNRTVRVNAPETGLDPSFGKRVEARGNGMMQILTESDLEQIDSVSLYLELWGGHPGTSNKLVSINGRSTYVIPEVGTEQNHCTYHYPLIPLKITDLANGYNAIQFLVRERIFLLGTLYGNQCLFKVDPEK